MISCLQLISFFLSEPLTGEDRELLPSGGLPPPCFLLQYNHCQTFSSNECDNKWSYFSKQPTQTTPVIVVLPSCHLEVPSELKQIQQRQWIGLFKTCVSYSNTQLVTLYYFSVLEVWISATTTYTITIVSCSSLFPEINANMLIYKQCTLLYILLISTKDLFTIRNLYILRDYHIS